MYRSRSSPKRNGPHLCYRSRRTCAHPTLFQPRTSRKDRRR
jgi:hypothetical protein